MSAPASSEGLRLPRNANGERPFFFDDPAADILLSMNMALLTEHLALRDRVQSLEALLAAGGSIGEGALDRYEPSSAEQAERDGHYADTAERVFYLLLQHVEQQGRS